MAPQPVVLVQQPLTLVPYLHPYTQPKPARACLTRWLADICRKWLANSCRGNACRQWTKSGLQTIAAMRKGFPYESAIKVAHHASMQLGSACRRKVCCIHNLGSLQERKQPETVAQQLWPRVANPESGRKTTRTGPQTRTSMQSTPQVACAEKWSMPLTLSLSAQSIVIAPTASVYMVSNATLIAGLRLGHNCSLHVGALRQTKLILIV